MSSQTDTPTVVEDFLDEDAEISGQKFVLLSFLSPENILADKNRFFFKKFLHSYEVDWKIKSLEKFIADTVNSLNRDLDSHSAELEKSGQSGAAEICRKNRISIDAPMESYKEFVKKQAKDVNQTKIEDAWDDFLFKEGSKLEDDFHAKNDFRTTVRGLKIRGTYSSSKEAELRAKKLQAKDKYHNILLGEVGKWLPWDPSPTKITEHEYAEEQLNTLMRKYKENEDKKEQFFEERKTRIGGGQKPSTKQVFGVASGDSSSDATSAVPTNIVVNSTPLADQAVASSADYAAVFNSPGDLAISRKIERDEAKKGDSREESTVSFST